MSGTTIRVEVDGRTASAADLRLPALVNYAHYTAMQVRRGRARGLELHLSRLDAANRELFDAGADAGRIRDCLRHALAGVSDASVRLSLFWSDAGDRTAVMIAVRPPDELPDRPQALRSVPYQRPVPHIKHAGTFAQTYYGRLAQREGFDDALLTGPDGGISEAAVANIAFFDGTELVWPDAPCLAGITMQLVRPRLASAGVPTSGRTVRLADVPTFSAALVANSRGVAPVGRIDDTRLPVDTGLMTTVTEIYESVPWDPI